MDADILIDVQRKFSTVKMDTLVTGDEFDKLEQKYRALRDQIKKLKDVLKAFKTIEHGGIVLKTLNEGLAKFVGEKPKEGRNYVKDNVYDTANLCFLGFSQKYGDSKNSELCGDIAQKFLLMSKQKHDLNLILEKIIVHIEKMKVKAGEVDIARKQMQKFQFKGELAKKNVLDQNKKTILTSNLKMIQILKQIKSIL
ncbi:hypothetical protein EDEG_00047 [Edhazardia aedis USNM 41457]|uniref:Uncharacterized protein n=1 Tax=Edhazardia aedis (strain USNM 41457) TaxID=1003232 RepID=J9A0D9_EDHAE|nr:hypothetical protein EDEG_00047 [Edhazardia aedis USNM 41457]|eukprot:EJW05383.1 hypothetical protein EDEG_00047 [Edhazardia aedis USNM 41457]